MQQYRLFPLLILNEDLAVLISRVYPDDSGHDVARLNGTLRARWYVY